MELITLFLVGTVTAAWRFVWLAFLLPAWRMVRWAVVVVIGAVAVDRLEREYEEGAYQN